MTPPLISLEEHFYSKAVFKTLDARGSAIFAEHPQFLDRLTDIDTWRLPSMDSNGVALQVISHAWQTGGASAQACQEGNDELARRMQGHPTRFAGFAVLPVGNATECAIELERAVKQLGFVGALVDNHVHGQFYEGPEYDPLWKKAQELDVPIYIHPTLAREDIVSSTQFTGNFSSETTMSLASMSWGWHSDTALHILRLFAGGVFDRFPSLKIIIGHFGEMLPFMLERCASYSAGWDSRRRSLLEVWNENIWITTSGVWSLDPLRCLLGNTKIDRILYSVDYPFTSNEQGLKWFKMLEDSGLLNDGELEQIAYKNAEKLLKVVVA